MAAEEDSLLGATPQLTPLETLRHSAAHVMAKAVQRLFPGTKVTIGPHVENGFYYDFDRKEPFTEDDLAKIEAEMKKIIDANEPFIRHEISRSDALAMFDKMGETYKVELINSFPEGSTITYYTTGDWLDLCRGPHVRYTNQIKAFKLMSVAGAYWRGKSTNPQLQRIYGTAFPNKTELEAYLTLLEEAKKRDHRKLGKELDLFAFHPDAPGAVFWTANGTMIFNALSGAMRHMCLSNGYVEIKTPLLYNKSLWEKSGHWGKYRENMFLILDPEADPNATEEERASFSLKPMNCPSHHLFYEMKRRSYRELPLRLHTQDVLHRNEATGVLSGLTRVRQFQQDDAHIYLMESQIADEVARLSKLIVKVYEAFGLSYTAKFATRPDKKIGDDALWDRAEAALQAALEATGMSYELKPGDGAFYGPKIDFDVADSLGRKWQLGTIQLDYNAPERFDLTYIGEDNSKHRPVVIHRAIYGSFERFFGILIEHYAGNFPVWLAPEQVRILPVGNPDRAVTLQHLDYAEQVAAELRAAGLRVDIDRSETKLGAMIREWQVAKVPYSLVVGAKDLAANAVTPRKHGAPKDEGMTPLAEFITRIGREAEIPF